MKKAFLIILLLLCCICLCACDSSEEPQETDGDTMPDTEDVQTAEPVPVDPMMQQITYTPPSYYKDFDLRKEVRASPIRLSMNIPKFWEPAEKKTDNASEYKSDNTAVMRFVALYQTGESYDPYLSVEKNIQPAPMEEYKKPRGMALESYTETTGLKYSVFEYGYALWYHVFVCLDKTYILELEFHYEALIQMEPDSQMLQILNSLRFETTGDTEPAILGDPQLPIPQGMKREEYKATNALHLDSGKIFSEQILPGITFDVPEEFVRFYDWDYRRYDKDIQTYRSVLGLSEVVYKLYGVDFDSSIFKTVFPGQTWRPRNEDTAVVETTAAGYEYVIYYFDYTISGREHTRATVFIKVSDLYVFSLNWELSSESEEQLIPLLDSLRVQQP